MLKSPFARRQPSPASSHPRLLLKMEGKADREAYERLMASATDDPRSSVPMGRSHREKSLKR